MRIFIEDQIDNEFLSEKLSDILTSYALFDGKTACYYFPCFPVTEILTELLSDLYIEVGDGE
jgi:hypothetical protein